MYQTQQFGSHFWRVIFGAHVYARIDRLSSIPSTCIPGTPISVDLARFLRGRRGMARVAGLVRLVAGAWTGRPPLARMIVLWWALPFVLISMGTSKIFHYAYPFLPPLALAAGWFVSDAARWIDGRSCRDSWRSGSPGRVESPALGRRLTLASRVLVVCAGLFLVSRSGRRRLVR